MEIAILITHYKRPDALINLITDIERELSPDDKALILIHDDYSGLDDSFFYDIENSPSNNIRFVPILSDHNHGKREYWKVINRMYYHIKKAANTYDFKYIFQLQEDVRLNDNFFKSSISLMQEANATCLNLLADQRKATKQWTNIQPQRISDNLWITGWVDMMFCATPMFFETLNYTINPVPDSWFTHPDRSSGVGMQISNRIVNAGLKFHQVDQSLAHHGDYDSVMHPVLRKLEPLKDTTIDHDSRYIVASLASIPSRCDALNLVVESILPQVNELYVYLNDYDNVPEFLNRKSVHVYRSQSFADLGDVGKFFASFFLDKNTYHLTLDDDIIYPSDYVRYMCDQVDVFNRKAIVTMHGRAFKQLPVKSYYRANVDPYVCSDNHTRNKYLHVPGTGVMAYHTSLVQFEISDFDNINMSDIYVARKAQHLNIPIIGVAHQALKLIDINNTTTIYMQCRLDDCIQTKVVNSINWKLNKF